MEHQDNVRDRKDCPGSQRKKDTRSECLDCVRQGGYSNMLVYLRDGSAQTILHAATLGQKLQIKLSISPSHSILTSPSTDPISPGAWQGSHWNANFSVTGMTQPRQNPVESGIRTRDLPLSTSQPGGSPCGFVAVIVFLLINLPASCYGCISWANLLTRLYVLPHCNY